MMCFNLMLILSIVSVSYALKSIWLNRATIRCKAPLSLDMSTVEEYEAVVKQLKTSLASSTSFPGPEAQMLSSFMDDYCKSNIEANETAEAFAKRISTFLKTVQEAIAQPYDFKPLHEAIREPFDYYKWGNDFFVPLVKANGSKFFGLENAKKILELVAKGDNVVILSNHQTEADPQVLSLLMEKEGEEFQKLVENMVFVAGHKVTSDPVAIPFSMGRNLLCIHSKKHIKNPPEDIPKKQAQNMESMKAMSELLSRPPTSPGAIMWVALSGGRDRPSTETGEFVVAPFDAKSLDMFKLQAMQSKKPMHFFPMAMYTHQLVPPPKDVSTDLGEERSARRGCVSVELLPATDGIGGLKDKEFAAALQKSVDDAYTRLVEYHKANGDHALL